MCLPRLRPKEELAEHIEEWRSFPAVIGLGLLCVILSPLVCLGTTIRAALEERREYEQQISSAKENHATDRLDSTHIRPEKTHRHLGRLFISPFIGFWHGVEFVLYCVIWILFYGTFGFFRGFFKNPYES